MNTPCNGNPTYEPTGGPTYEPSEGPSVNPSYEPSFEPTGNPTYEPTGGPTYQPTKVPTPAPTDFLNYTVNSLNFDINYVNNWQQTIAIDVSNQNKVICGAHSIHWNSPEDRRWKFKYCDVTSTAGAQYTVFFFFIFFKFVI